MIEASSSRQMGLCLDCERFPVTNGQLCSKFSAMQIQDFSICFILSEGKNEITDFCYQLYHKFDLTRDSNTTIPITYSLYVLDQLGSTKVTSER